MFCAGGGGGMRVQVRNSEVQCADRQVDRQADR